MIVLVYVSCAVRQFSQAELAALLQSSRHHNASLGVTGLLLYVGGNFMQALEGDSQTVDELFQTIAADPRHRLIKTIWRAAITKRQFPDWAMGFRETESLPAALRAEISSFLDDALHEESAPGELALVRRPALRLLQQFAVTMR